MQDLTSIFQILHQTRRNLQSAADGLSFEQLTTIPEGFSNNIAWNLGHIYVTQHLLTFGLSKLDTGLGKQFTDRYRKGSKPDRLCTLEECSSILIGLGLSVESLEKAYHAGALTLPAPYPTSFGFELQTIEDAICFNATHEALHLGYIMAIKKAL